MTTYRPYYRPGEWYIGVPYYFNFTSVEEVKEVYPDLSISQAEQLVVDEADIRYAISRECIQNRVPIRFAETIAGRIITGYGCLMFVVLAVYGCGSLLMRSDLKGR